MKRTILIHLLLTGIFLSAPVMGAEDTAAVTQNECNNTLKLTEKDLKIELPFDATQEQVEKLKRQAKKAQLEKQVVCLLSLPNPNPAQQTQLAEKMAELSTLLPKNAEEKGWMLASCELDPKASASVTASDDKEWKIKVAQMKLEKLAAQINCLLAKDKIDETQEKKLAELIKSQYLAFNYITAEEQASGRIISMFELGGMRQPDYSDGKNNGFSTTKLYFDSKIDGRFHFTEPHIILNASFDASFYGSGSFETPKEDSMTESDGDAEADTDTPAIASTESGFPTKFNQVSDTLDASFSLRLALDNCEDKYDGFIKPLRCLSSSKDGQSSLGLLLSYGFLNKDKKLEDEDTVNHYRAFGLEYRHFRTAIVGNTNRVPDFIVSYQRAKFEQYGVEKFTDDCPEPADCFRPIENTYRYLFKLKYRLVADKPYFIGFRLNAGRGADDYGLTLGIRKSGTDILDILGIQNKD